MIDKDGGTTTSDRLAHRRAALRYVLMSLVVVCPLAENRAWADVLTPLAGYEPEETGLTVTANAGDTGLTVTMVQGGVGGAPAATEGAYVLEVDIVGEADGKVEFTHSWSASTYDLAGQDELLADVYIATPSAIPSLMGIWDANWNPPDAWQQAAGIPQATGQWVTISFDLAGRSQVGLNQIWAFIFEGM
ncbi:MAG: hypothetical protein GY778_08155, partial [bacterium]|nr:hypothetical protein [bacterium]